VYERIFVQNYKSIATKEERIRDSLILATELQADAKVQVNFSITQRCNISAVTHYIAAAESHYHSSCDWDTTPGLRKWQTEEDIM